MMMGRPWGQVYGGRRRRNPSSRPRRYSGVRRSPAFTEPRQASTPGDRDLVRAVLQRLRAGSVEVTHHLLLSHRRPFSQPRMFPPPPGQLPILSLVPERQQ
ncbi:MAG TPA: hypothetical protein PLI07_02755, partial [Candidatus Hydrogenedentes bacterium]|nr:hypothetical protein [Candidatus Hydrogenedentota bacterium]